jgi:putative ABC transport system permease protein
MAFRNFRREKAYTTLNVFGLALGMAASLLIIQYVKYERSFDSMHSRAEDIYRIQYNGWQNGVLNFESAVSVPAAAAALKENFGEVEYFTRFLPTGAMVSYEPPGAEPITYREERVFFADTSLFKVFDFQLIRGNATTCLKGTNKVIISESNARKYFDDADPIGKRLNSNRVDQPLDVTGVFQDIPENSHIQFDFLISYETINALTENQSETSWDWYDFYSFVLLRPNTDVKALQSKWDLYLSEVRKEAWEKSNQKQEFILRPLTDIHLYSNLLYETSPESLRDGNSVYALSFIAIFILVIAWVNYINLSTARSFKRANEVGVRKVVGAFRGQLVSQFLVESAILNGTALLLALGIVRLAWSSFSDLTGWHIPLQFVLEREFWFLVIAIFLGGAILSGFYPAVILSSFKPVSVLKGKIIRSSRGNYLRKGLVVFQFVASVSLISGVLIVYQQLKFMKSKDLGIEIGETLVLKGPGRIDSLYQSRFDAFKTEALRVPGIRGVTASTGIPGVENYWTRGLARLSGGPTGRSIVTHLGIDENYVPQYGIQIRAGRNFSRNFPADGKRILINESLSQLLGFDDPEQAVGESVTNGRDTLEIAGVLEDYHQMSVKAKVIPVAFRFTTPSAFYSLKLETTHHQDVVNSLEPVWSSFFPESPMDYFFLDQFFNRQYERDDRFGQVFGLFTVLAIIIACLGLLGLASFMTVQRTKEIGIRKALGATVSGIIGLLSQQFMKPVFIAIVIACPTCWWLMSQWLQSFPYRISISPLVFLVSGIVVLAIAFISILSQTLRAALLKPSQSLKYE